MSCQKERNYNRSAGPILIVDLASCYGGAEVRVLDLAKSLHNQYPYAVATLAGSPLHQRLDEAGLVSLPVPYARSDPRLLLFLRRAIRQQGYLVVDAHNVQSQFWAQLAAILAGPVKKVTTVHSAYRLEHCQSLKGHLYEQVLHLNAWLGAHFIAVSATNNSYLQSIGIPPERISIIPNCINPSPYCCQGRDSCLLKSWGWAEDAYIVTVVARLEPVKGHTFLIEALGQTIKQHPQLRCLIVGEGRSRAELESRVKQANLNGYIHFTGFINNIPLILKSSSVFCLPSLSEGLPYALLEACSHRLPILATQVGGMAELLTHRQNAFLVPPANPEALAEGLCWLMTHPQEADQLGQAASTLVQQKFNPQEMINRTLAVYQS